MFPEKGNKLYASGSNIYGQLGLGDTIDRPLWTEIEAPFEAPAE